MRLLHTMKFLIFPSKENPNLQEVEIGKKNCACDKLLSTFLKCLLPKSIFNMTL